MELYILDSELRRTTVIDQFESLIWTERFNDIGDFELVLHSNARNRTLIPDGALLTINHSKRIMVAETAENKTDDDGRPTLTISGRSLESTLMNRSVYSEGLGDGAVITPIVYDGVAGEIARLIVNDILRENSYIPSDNLPFLQPEDESLYPPGTIPEPIDGLHLELDRNATVYSALKAVIDPYVLGMRLYRGPDDTTLYFDIYAGNDRTSTQSSLTPIVFSPSLDNLSNVTELRSLEPFKNVAYVMSDNGSRIVFAEGVDPTTSGFNRRVIPIQADDITLEPGPQLNEALDRRGREVLALNKVLSAVDGEISEHTPYVYDLDYMLGDLVEIRASDGLPNRMRITEQIFVEDAQGERKYPTLEAEAFITPGSWFAWDFSQVWDQATGTWIEA